MMGVRTSKNIALGMVVAIASPAVAGAQCTDAESLWTASAPGVGMVEMLSHDGSYNPNGIATVYVSQGGDLFALDTANRGQLLWHRRFAGGSIAFIGPVIGSRWRASGGAWGEALDLYVTGTDGYIGMFDGYSGEAVYDFGFVGVDTRRAACRGDGLGGPTVQVHQWSNADFQSAQSRDLTMAPTRFQCGTESANQVVAMSGGQVAWRFNHDEFDTMDYGVAGCNLDYDNNALYCGTNEDDPNLRKQTLWAISTLDGTLLWSAAAGAVLHTPNLTPDGLHTASVDGVLRQFDAATGDQKWSYDVGEELLPMLWTEFRGAYAGSLFVATLAGELKRIDASSGVPVEAWSAPYQTRSFGVSPSAEKIYVGADDGRIYQLDLGTGAEEASANAGSDPTALGFDLTPGAQDIDRLTVGTVDEVKQYCLPWQQGWQGNE